MTVDINCTMTLSNPSQTSGANSATTSLLAPSTVIFSDDETFVFVNYLGFWNIRRPVVEPWAYTPAGKTWWVGVSGSDSASGTQSNPFATIQHAVSGAVSGDCIYVQSGTYAQKVLIEKGGLILSCAPKSLGGGLGTVTIAPPPSVFSGNPPDVPVVWLHCPDSTTIISDSIINGLVIEGSLAAGVLTPDHFEQCGVVFTANTASGTGHNVKITNNVCWGHSHCGIKEMNQNTGLGTRLAGNICFGNGTNSNDHGIYWPGDAVTMDGNVCFGNVGAGLHLYANPASGFYIRNICWQNQNWGALLSTNNATVVNNVFCGLGETWGIMYYRSGCDNNIVENNICAFNTTDVTVDNAGGAVGDPALNIDNFNCYKGIVSSGVPGKSGQYGPNNILGQDPLFTSRTTGDFSLGSGSPCSGTGNPTYGVNIGAF